MPLPLEPQLDGSTLEGMDCGPATGVTTIRYMSGGLINTSTERFRKKMGGDRDQTNPDQWVEAIKNFAPEFRRVGLQPPKVSRVTKRDMSNLWELLYKKQRPAMMVIDYGVVADEGRWFWSSRSFRGLHAVLYRRAIITPKGERQVKVYDPLADGRTLSGKKMRKGPNWWPWSLARSAAESAPPTGVWQGVIAFRSLPLVAPAPDPAEPEPPIVEEERIGEAVNAAYDDLELAQQHIDEAMEKLREYVPADSDSDADGDAGVEGE